MSSILKWVSTEKKEKPEITFYCTTRFLKNE